MVLRESFGKLNLFEIMRLTLLLFIVALLLSIRLFFFYSERHIYQENEIFKETYSMIHEPKQNSIGQYFFIGNVLISLPSYPSYQYGNVLKIEGRVSKLTTEKGSLLIVKNPTVSIVTDSNPFVQVSKFIRYRIEESVLTTIPKKEAGLLLGVILGVRDKIDSEYYGQLRQSGVLHVVAASGQNVSIIASLLLSIFLKIVKRRVALLFTGVGILAYAFLTGFDPSIVRASLMALIALGALVIGRQSIGLYALFVTGVIMIFIDPSMIEDISFQLSFMSTFGILTIKPLLDHILKLKFLILLRDDITTTMSAQIATMPIMLASFGLYSILTIPINVAVLWTIPILMIFGGVGAMLAIVEPLLGVPFILLSYPFLAYFTKTIEYTSNFSFGMSVDSIPVALQIGYYLIMLALVVRFKKNEGGKI